MSLQKLIIEDDAGKTIVVPLTRDVITIGRKDGNTIRLTERNVSRNHAKLERLPEAVFVEDLGSYNGVKLNGDKIKGRVEIREGDLIEIGDYHLALQADAQQAGFDVANDETQTGAVEDDYDQFAGDTQRWEPPVSYEDATMQDQAPLSMTARAMPDETIKLPASGPHPPALGAGASATATGAALVEPTLGDMTGATALESAGLAAPSGSTDSQESLLPPPGLDALEGRGITAPMTAPLMVEPEQAPEPEPSSLDGASGPSTSAAVPSLADNGDDETQALAPAPSEQDETALPRFVALTTVFAGSVFPLTRPETVIGRVDDNDMVIEHRSVSRSHAKIYADPTGCRIVDLKSANGILLNGVEVGEAVLKSGDVVELGRVQLRYVPPGGRFALSPDEIERARVADVAGDDFADDAGGTMSVPGVGIPISPVAAAQRQQRLMMAAMVAVILLLLLVIFILLFRSDGEDAGDPTVEVPTTTDGEPRTGLEALRALNEEGRYLEVVAQGEVLLAGDADNPGVIAEVDNAKRKGKSAALKAFNAAIEGRDVEAAKTAHARLVRFGESDEALARLKGRLVDLQERLDEPPPVESSPKGATGSNGATAEPESAPPKPAAKPPASPTSSSASSERSRPAAKPARRTKKSSSKRGTGREKSARASSQSGADDKAAEVERLYELATLAFARSNFTLAKRLAYKGLAVRRDARFYWIVGKSLAGEGDTQGAISNLTRVVNGDADPSMRGAARKAINDLKMK